MGELMGVIGVLTGFVSAVMTIGIVFWWIYWSYRKKQLQYHERQLMIEKGLTPPPILPEQPVTPESALRRGTVLLSLGIGFGVAAALGANLVDEDLGGVLAVTGTIVGFIGAGNLAYYFIARRSTRQASERPDMAL
jgi:preprotein translocase subunit YajC